MKKIIKKDLDLLRLLDENARYSFSQLAKKSHLNKETVKYRIHRLEQKGILKGFWLIPSSRIGFVVHKILVKNKNLSDLQAFIAFLQQPAVSWFATVEGSWDFIITTLTKDLLSFNKFYEGLMVRFGKHFEKKDLLIATRVIELNEKFLCPKGRLEYEVDQNIICQPASIDEKDEHIIKELGRNGRITFKALSEEIGITPEAVAQRYKKLEQQDIILKIKPRVDIKQLDLHYYHLFVELNDIAKRANIISHYKQHPSCVSMMTHIGNFDLHLEFIAKEQDASTILNDLREQFGEQLRRYELLHIVEEYRMKICC